jgi:hypothetical protein
MYGVCRKNEGSFGCEIVAQALVQPKYTLMWAWFIFLFCMQQNSPSVAVFLHLAVTVAV